jgi:hypothetical protein
MNGAKRTKLEDMPLNLPDILVLLKSECPALVNLDNNIVD